MVDEGSVILTSGGGMSMGAVMSGSSTEEKHENREEVDLLRLASNWWTAAREVRKPAKIGGAHV